MIGKAVVIAPVGLGLACCTNYHWLDHHLFWHQVHQAHERWRWPVRIIGGTLVVILATLILNPWLRADMLGITSHQRNERAITHCQLYFPIRDDDGNRVHTGQTAIVRATEADACKGHYVACHGHRLDRRIIDLRY